MVKPGWENCSYSPALTESPYNQLTDHYKRQKKQIINIILYVILAVIFCLQVTDFAKYGNIYEAKLRLTLSMVNVIQMVTQIASALEYLDSKNVVHLRLHSTSIFVVASGKVHDIWFCVYQNLISSGGEWSFKIKTQALINALWNFTTNLQCVQQLCVSWQSSLFTKLLQS